MKEDFDWYVKNLKHLYEKYGDTFLVIKNKKIIGTFDNYLDAINKTSEKEKIGSFIVQRCGKDESVYTNYISSFNFTL